MKSLISWLKWYVTLAVLLLCSCSWLNSFQKDGELKLEGLIAQVTVMRDEKGMAYIYAQNRHDATMAQGFVTAQDRLFQMEFLRLLSSGRLSELAGDAAKNLDIRTRTIGFYRNAQKHANLLNEPSRSFLQNYIDGVNAYIQNCADDYPIEFKLTKITPQPWSIVDSLTVLYFMSWDSSGNVQTEIMAQMLVEKLGLQKAKEIFPLNINPDDPDLASTKIQYEDYEAITLGLASDKKLATYLRDDYFLAIGSNSWTTGSHQSQSSKPILANDTHQYASILPGPWYPICLITPSYRTVGVMVPGLPGMVVGRNEHIAVGVTNAYGDIQDLYVETIDPNDPNRYLEAQTSLPFKVIEETLTIKDKKAPEGFRKEKIKIRLTRRGPVISGVMRNLETEKVLTLRWSPFETMSPQLGIDGFLTAKTIADVRESLRHVNIIMLNFVFADSNGNIGWHVSGKLPIRSKGNGTVPMMVLDSQDNWKSYVPFEQMPHLYNPAKGWIGTCNHLAIGRDYPYYYTSDAASTYRYRRLKNLLNNSGAKSAENHWQYQRDTLNLLAQKIVPLMTEVLLDHENTKVLAEILSAWNFHDVPDSPAPTIFQAIYRQFALLVFKDELGENLARKMLGNWYFWQERLDQMILEGRSVWFDDINTENKIETRDELIYQAALNATSELEALIGSIPENWLWGEVHQMEFVSLIRRNGFGKGLLGGGSYQAAGSGETLYRGLYDFNRPYAVQIPASLRMVVDLGDNDKVLAVLPGGISDRMFTSHTKDQIKAYMNGEKVHWWFSDKSIKAHCKNTLVLKP